MNADGSAKRKLGGGEVRLPWSPDGATSSSARRLRSHRSILCLTAAAARLARGDDTSWSLDGADDPLPARLHPLPELRVVNADGSDQRTSAVASIGAELVAGRALEDRVSRPVLPVKRRRST